MRGLERETVYFLVTSGLVVVMGGVAVIAATPNDRLLGIGLAFEVLGALAIAGALLGSILLVRLRQAINRRFPRRSDMRGLTAMRYPNEANRDVGVPLVAFTTGVAQGPKPYRVPHQDRVPHCLSIVAPVRATVRIEDIPYTVHLRRRDIRITNLIKGGFVVEEGRSEGEDVRIEVFF